MIFENQDTKEQIEIICTPSHRFYIKEKGWVTAETLQNGDQCTSANGTEIIFLSREELKDQQHVYNFEVEEKHTYFAGTDIVFLLAHNQCGSPNGTNVLMPDGSVRFISDNINPKVLPSIIHFDTITDLDRPYVLHPTVSKEHFKKNLKDLEKLGYTYSFIQNPNSFGLSDKEYKLALSSLTEYEYMHFITRIKNNNYKEFLFLDLEVLSNKNDKEIVESGGYVHAYFFGERWILLNSWASQLHSRNKNGTDCFKWCSDSGRELVIRNDHILEVDADRIGTFNYSLPSDVIWHSINDLCPYYIYGKRNILDTQQMRDRANKLQQKIDQFHFEHNFRGFDWH